MPPAVEPAGRGIVSGAGSPQQLLQSLVELLQHIWTTVLGMPLEHNADPTLLQPLEGQRTITACVQLSGAWDGSVLIFCSMELARRMAAIMFDEQQEDLGTEEIEDAMGELGNITAGNVKRLFPGQCQLSLPAVVDGVDYRLIVPGSMIQTKILMQCDDEPLLFTVLRRQDKQS